MNIAKKQQDEGFTIIEVVLVLAIAALILLMVFLALPALQRNQRDTQRKNDVSRLQSALNNYKSSARGALPPVTGTNGLTNANDDGFLARYLRKDGDSFADPAGDNYELTNTTTTPTWDQANAKYIYYNLGGSCGDGQNPTFATSASSSTRKMILVKPLESGGIQCQQV